MNRATTITAARMLAVDAIAKANSGHPGLPLGAMPALNAIYAAMKNDPTKPEHVNRDRFVLSAGHGSAGLYATLHLFGYDVTLEDIGRFRQFGSKTPGHPEYGVTKGVDVSTGPLGQGIANAVGMAIAETRLAAEFNREGFNVFDHYTYALCGEGCLMEGISYEAMSLAGTLKLSKLILVYDKNDITIEGDKNTSFTEDVAERFNAMDWHVEIVEDGNDVNALDKAIVKCKVQGERPSVIISKTRIGFGSPLAGSASVHGSPLTGDKLSATKAFYGWNYEPFVVPEEAYEFGREIASFGAKKTAEYDAMMKEYAEKYPELYAKLQSYLKKDKIDVANMETGITDAMATRKVSSEILNKLEKLVLNLFGGSADLGPSNLTVMKDRKYYSPECREGSNVHFGIREQAMAAVCNGIALHGGLRPYCSTFFVFSDYMKGSMRMSALMGLPVTYVLTHDSIGVGEDGPTHEPIEQLSALRSTPGMYTFRPADATETLCAWDVALNSGKPTVLVLSRQNLPQLTDTSEEALKGGYIVKTAENPEIILMASGSELHLAVEVYDRLSSEGVKARVVSIPCHELFLAQGKDYVNSVLPSSVTARIAIEAGATMSWDRFVGLQGAVIGINEFGRSSKPDALFTHYGITADNLYKKAVSLLSSTRK